MSLACADVVPDGVCVDSQVVPKCLNLDLCVVKGCLWRRWHQFGPDQYRAKVPPKYAPFLELVT